MHIHFHLILLYIIEHKQQQMLGMLINKEELGGNEYAFIKQAAWQSLKDYYEENK